MPNRVVVLYVNVVSCLWKIHRYRPDLGIRLFGSADREHGCEDQSAVVMNASQSQCMLLAAWRAARFSGRGGEAQDGEANLSQFLHGATNSCAESDTRHSACSCGYHHVRQQELLVPRLWQGYHCHNKHRHPMGRVTTCHHTGIQNGTAGTET